MGLRSDGGVAIRHGAMSVIGLMGMRGISLESCLGLGGFCLIGGWCVGWSADESWGFGGGELKGRESGIDINQSSLL